MKGFAAIMYVVAIGFAIFGTVTMFTYGEYNSDTFSGDDTGHIVAGDAYNYIIIGVRGTGLIGVGVISAVIGTGLLLLSNKEATFDLDDPLAPTPDAVNTTDESIPQ